MRLRSVLSIGFLALILLASVDQAFAGVYSRSPILKAYTLQKWYVTKPPVAALPLPNRAGTIIQRSPISIDQLEGRVPMPGSASSVRGTQRTFMPTLGVKECKKSIIDAFGWAATCADSDFYIPELIDGHCPMTACVLTTRNNNMTVLGSMDF